jgi:hypothetical protein
MKITKHLNAILPFVDLVKMKGMHSRPKRSQYAEEFSKAVGTGKGVHEVLPLTYDHLLHIVRDPETGKLLRKYIRDNSPSVISRISKDMNTVNESQRENMAFLLAMTGDPKAMELLGKLGVDRRVMLDAYHILATSSRSPEHKRVIVNQLMKTYWAGDLESVDKKLVVNTLGRLKRDIGDTVEKHLRDILKRENDSSVKEMARKYLDAVHKGTAS